MEHHEKSDDVSRFDVIVIGGGVSGLSAAKFLFDNGVSNLCLLEARSRVGGRTCTEDVTLPSDNGGEGNTIWCDVGGAYVGPTQDRILRIAKEFGIETYLMHMEGKSLLKLCGKPYTTYTGSIPSLSLLSLLDLNSILRETFNLGAKIPMREPWNAPNAKEWDSMTVKQWIDKQAWTDDAKALFTAAVSSLFCAEPQELSFLYFLWFVSSGDGFKRLIDTENGAQERKFVGGSQNISNAMAKYLGDKVRLNKCVRAIEWENWGGKGIRLTVSSPTNVLDASYYVAKRIIIAIPPSLYSSISTIPSLPPLKSQLGQRMPTGSIFKTITYYRTPFWREKGFTGAIVNDEGPVLYSIDDCKPDKNVYALMGFVNARFYREWAQKTKEERMKAVCNEYANAFKCEEARNPLHYVEKDWTTEQFSSGCYFGYMPPNALTQFGKVMREPVGPMHFAGTELATRWMGYMDGAVQSGERAAGEVLMALKDELGLVAINTQASAFTDIEEPSKDLVGRYAGLTTVEKYLPTPPTFLGLLIALGIVTASTFGRYYYKWGSSSSSSSSSNL